MEVRPPTPKTAKPGYLKKRASSFWYAYKGLRLLITTQANFVIHLVASIIVTCAGFYFHISPMEWVAVVFAIGLVWIMEAMNTAIELLVDLVSPEYNPLAGKVKDVAAAAVLIAALTALIVGLIVFLPKVIPSL